MTSSDEDTSSYPVTSKAEFTNCRSIGNYCNVLKVSILCSNLSSNALGRAYLLARVIQRHYAVEILGPTFGDGIWPPCSADGTLYKPVPGRTFPGFFLSTRELLRKISGDVIYAVKPRLTSFGVGLLAEQLRETPLIVDIDDWDYQGTYNLPRWRRLLRMARMLYDPYANQYLPLMERLIPRADGVTVVSTLLQERFGGIYLPHGRDTDYLNPDRYSGATLRESWALTEHKIVMFLGTPRPHKGLEELINALHRLPTLPLVLVVVGAKLNDSYSQKLLDIGGDKVRLIGMRPFHEIPRFLAAADVVALPQWNVPFAQAQVPAKVFDAMAMARPIVATRVGDLPKILEGCGLVVGPGDVEALSEAIRRVILEPDLASDLGSKARQRCIEEYSWDVMEKTLVNLLDQVTEGQKH